MSDTYTCECCGKRYECTLDDDLAARNEAEENFPGCDPDDEEQMATVCDDCYRQIMEACHPGGIPPRGGCCG